MVEMQFTEPLEKPYSRLGVGFLIYTNGTLQPGQKFTQTDFFDFGVELEPGNFLVSYSCGTCLHVISFTT